MRRIPFTFLVLTFAGLLFSQSIKTESDLYSVYSTGEIDFETYLMLRDMMDNKTGLCESMDRLAAIPDITPEDLDTLNRLCSMDKAHEKELPPEVLEKTGAFIAFTQDRERLNAEYRFSRDLADTATAFEKEHGFSLRYGQDDITVRSQGKSDAFGSGYFYRNSVEIKNKGPVRRLALGTFRRNTGLGLTFGGIARTSEDTGAPASFSGSVLSPAAREPFGACLSLEAGWFSPFAFITADQRMPAAGDASTLRAAGMEYSHGPVSAGLLALSSRTLLSHPGSAIEASCIGAYSSFYRNKATFRTEVSFSQEGYAFEIRGLKKSGAFDAGISARQYSPGYFNPAGRGESPFSGRISEKAVDKDTARFYGLRSGEWGGELFARFRGNAFYIRPSLSSARSSRFQAERSAFSLQEHLDMKRISSGFTAEQSCLLRKETGAISRQTTLALSSESSPLGWFSFRTRCRLRSEQETVEDLYARMDFWFLPFSRLKAGAGYFILAPLAENGLRQHGILLEEKFQMNYGSSIRFYGTLIKSGNGPMQPHTIGLSCNFSVI